MRKSFKHLFAALATTAMLAGCAKEITPPNFENDKVNSEGSRVIAVSFGQQTKTTLGSDGLTPKFADGDSILLISYPEDSNEETITDTCRVKVDDTTGEATISTNLTGPLTALYPAKFVESDLDFEIPSVQSGKFSDANLCYAEMEGEDESSLQFVNYSAILKFYVDESIGVTSLKITSSSKRIAKNSYTIIVKAPEDKTLADVTDDPEKRICYVALDCGKDLFSNQLAFEIETTTQGTVTRAPTNTGKVRIGYMYNAFIPYYIEVNGQKWAYCNIGAFLPEEPGEYFSWAEVKGHKADTTKQIEDGFRKGAFTTDFTAFSEIAKTDSRYSANWNSSAGFGHCNAPYAKTDVGGYTKYSISALNTLEPADDAATANWGDKWRMPTRKEYEDLLENPHTSWLNSYNSSGQSGLAFQNEDNQLFFPAAGFGVSECDLMVRSIAENDIYYNVGGFWSSSVASSGNEAYAMNFFVGVESSVENASRENGFPIRPIYVAPAPTPTPADVDYIEIKAKYNGTDSTILKWSRQNLAITDSGKKAWKGGNTSGAVKVPGTDSDVVVGDYFQWAANEGYCGDASNTDKGLLIYTDFTSTGCGDSEDKFTFKSAGESITYRFNTASTDTSVGISPYYSDSAYDKYTKTSSSEGDGKNVLVKNDDVASIILGGTWRMPTADEFKAMKDATYWAWDDNDKGYYVFAPNANHKAGNRDGSLPSDLSKSAALLFFPATGRGNGDLLSGAGTLGRYWSSDLYSENVKAYGLNFGQNTVSPQSYSERYYGWPVRPVSD